MYFEHIEKDQMYFDHQHVMDVPEAPQVDGQSWNLQFDQYWNLMSQVCS